MPAHADMINLADLVEVIVKVQTPEVSMSIQMPHKVYPGIIKMIVEKVNLRRLEIRNFEIDSVEMVELVTMHKI